MNRPDITLFLVLTNKKIESSRRSYYKEFVQQFSKLIVIAEKETDDRWIRSQIDHKIEYRSKEHKVAGLNQALEEVHTSHILLLESDEHCRIADLPGSLENKTCYRARIEVKSFHNLKHNYQVRLFPAFRGAQKLIQGTAIADLSAVFFELGWTMGETIMPVQKSSSLFNMADAEAEDIDTLEGMSAFWKAIIYSHTNQYQRAEEMFRRVLKNDNLFEFDYLAALNGLVNALVEQHKLELAEEVAYRSLETNPQQRAPYISLHKIKKLQGCAEESYHYLNTYLRVYSIPSSANMDVDLSIEDCHFLMADTSFKQGDYKRAFRHYDQFYELNNGAVSQQILEKLFIYAIELKDFEKAVQYFDDIFGQFIPDNLDANKSARLLESLSLFMDNGWYDFVSRVYKELVAHNPDDNKLLNGWITTLIKNKEVEKAQELLKARKAS